MQLNIQHYRNKIVDYLYVPDLILENSNEDDVSREQELIKAPIKKSLLFLKKDIEQHYLFGYPHSLLHYIYFDLLRNGQDPKTLDEFLTIVETLSTDYIVHIMVQTLLSTIDTDNTPDKTPRHDLVYLLTLLEWSGKSIEQKWNWAMAIRDPKKAVDNMIAIVRQVAKVYDVFYKEVEDDIERYVDQFAIEAFQNKVTLSGLMNYFEKQDTPIYTFILSKWHFRLSFTHNSDTLPAFTVSANIEEFLYSLEKMNIEEFVECLKLLGDETRYAVLQEVIKPNVKTKQIAQQLNITSAAVSFHTQKMINNQLLILDIDSSDVKYTINKDLFKMVINKLKQDFEIE